MAGFPLIRARFRFSLENARINANCLLLELGQLVTVLTVSVTNQHVRIVVACSGGVKLLCKSSAALGGLKKVRMKWGGGCNGAMSEN